MTAERRRRALWAATVVALVLCAVASAVAVRTGDVYPALVALVCAAVTVGASSAAMATGGDR